MRQQGKILHPPEDLKEIHAFYYNNNQIVLLYSISSAQSEWIKIYKKNHSDNQDIESWCRNRKKTDFLLQNLKGRIFLAFKKK